RRPDRIGRARRAPAPGVRHGSPPSSAPARPAPAVRARMRPPAGARRRCAQRRYRPLPCPPPFLLGDHVGIARKFVLVKPPPSHAYGAGPPSPASRGGIAIVLA